MTTREMVDQLMDTGNLSKWEESFLMSIADQLDRGRPLTERQQEILERLLDEKV